MFLRILKKDLKRKKTMNMILLIFMVLASLFIASSVNNIKTVFTALDEYFEMAEAPDYWIAMTDADEEARFREFADKNGYPYSRTELVQADPKDVTVSGRKFDYSNTLYLSVLGAGKVFDCNAKEITQIHDGEIYVTSEVFHSDKNDFYEGCNIEIESKGRKKVFTLKGYSKDAFFGSPMIGMTRFLVSKNDYAFFVDETSSVMYSDFIYTKRDDFLEKFKELELNTIFNDEGSVLRKMYLMDMLNAAIMLSVSICLILISMVILHFTIGFTMSEEYREIGVMKAIGISNKRIRGIYIAKYAAISGAAAAIGLVLSIPFGKLMLGNISKSIIISVGGNVFLNILCAIGTMAVVVGFCYFCTGKIRKFSPVDAIRNGEKGERYRAKGIFHLNKSKINPVIFMAVNDILSGWKRYISMIVIFTLGILLIIIPINSINTLRSDHLICWFNMAESDHVISQEVLFSVEKDNKKEIIENLAQLKEVLRKKGIEAEVFQEIMFRMNVSFGDKKTSSLAFCGVGDVTADRYQYIEGSAPQNNREVAISHIISERLGAQIGDEVKINTGSEIKTYLVTAINQSMNNMGEGIRFYQEETLDYHYAAGSFGIQVRYTDNPNNETLAERKILLEVVYPDAEIYTDGEYINDLIGNFAGELEGIKNLILGIVLCINMLVAVLMVKSFITKEKGDIAMLKAIGFQNASLTVWQSIRIGIVLFAAVILGILLQYPISKCTVEPIFEMMGAYSIEFEVEPFEVYVMYPLLVLAVTTFAALVSAQGLRKIPASEISNME